MDEAAGPEDAAQADHILTPESSPDGRDSGLVNGHAGGSGLPQPKEASSPPSPEPLSKDGGNDGNETQSSVSAAASPSQVPLPDSPVSQTADNQVEAADNRPAPLQIDKGKAPADPTSVPPVQFSMSPRSPVPRGRLTDDETDTSGDDVEIRPIPARRGTLSSSAGSLRSTSSLTSYSAPREVALAAGEPRSRSSSRSPSPVLCRADRWDAEARRPVSPLSISDLSDDLEARGDGKNQASTGHSDRFSVLLATKAGQPPPTPPRSRKHVPGSIVEARFPTIGDEWYPAVVKSQSALGVVVRSLGFGNLGLVERDAIRPTRHSVFLPDEPSDSEEPAGRPRNGKRRRKGRRKKPKRRGRRSRRRSRRHRQDALPDYAFGMDSAQLDDAARDALSTRQYEADIGGLLRTDWDWPKAGGLKPDLLIVLDGDPVIAKAEAAAATAAAAGRVSLDEALGQPKPVPRPAVPPLEDIRMGRRPQAWSPPPDSVLQPPPNATIESLLAESSHRRFAVHKLIVAAACPKWLNSLAAAESSWILHVRSVAPDPLGELLYWMYHGALGLVDPASPHLVSLYEAAQKLDLLSLQLACVDLLALGFNPHNVAELLVVAQDSMDPYLKAKALEYIESSLPDIVETPSFQGLDKIHLLEVLACLAEPSRASSEVRSARAVIVSLIEQSRVDPLDSSSLTDSGSSSGLSSGSDSRVEDGTLPSRPGRGGLRADPGGFPLPPKRVSFSDKPPVEITGGYGLGPGGSRSNRGFKINYRSSTEPDSDDWWRPSGSATRKYSSSASASSSSRSFSSSSYSYTSDSGSASSDWDSQWEEEHWDEWDEWDESGSRSSSDPGGGQDDSDSVSLSSASTYGTYSADDASDGWAPVVYFPHVDQ